MNMFTPIKNFITYIQKNASGSSIFGNGSPNDNTNNSSDLKETNAKMEDNSTIVKSASADLAEAANINNILESDPLRDFEEDQNQSNNNVNEVDAFLDDIEEGEEFLEEKTKDSNNESVTELILGLGNDVDSEEFIENDKDTSDSGSDRDLLNKSNEEAGNSFSLESSNEDFIDADPLQVGSVEDLTSLCGEEQMLHTNHDEFCSFESSRQATPTIDDEFQEFIAEPLPERTANDDLISVDSVEIITAGEETAEEIVTEEEDVGDGFLKLDDIRKPDVILVNDTDLNSSLASDALSEDPLATDNFPSGSISLLEDSNDNASEDVEFLWQSVHTGEQVVVGKIQKTSSSDCFIVDSIESTPERSKLLRQQERGLRQSLQQDTPKSLTENQEELRCDNSDSGLGSETSTLLQTLLTSPIGSITNSRQLNPIGLDETNQSSSEGDKTLNACTLTLQDELELGARALPPIENPISTMKPLRSNLKRRLDVEDMSIDLTDGSSTSACSSSSIEGIHKKPKRSINFESVQVYYFPRQQGFGCVPSAGGCTLGMGPRHISFKTLTLAEHAAELRRAHRLQLQDNPRGSSSDDSEESEEDYLSEGSGSDLDAETNGFLQPMSPKQRRALLKAAGVRKIDASEKAECRDIRNSREVCGCNCRDFCDPETCSCNQAGIKCQVDRVNFPCGCSRDACCNTIGRVEFNPARVRTHFIHTIMRLEMENRQQQNPATANLYASPHHSSNTSTSSMMTAQNGNNQTTNFYNSLQSQSNYSSGYASPAYLSDQNIGTNSVGTYYPQTGTTTNAHFNAGEMHQHHPSTGPYHPIDSLDSNLFSGNSNATPAYGEIMPNYSNSGTNGYHNISYEPVTPVNLFTSYQPQTSNSYTHNNCSNGFSSCAVPSIPPFGSATTTASTDDTHYQNVTTTACLSLNSATSLSNTLTSDSNCVTGNLEDSCGSNFINLNTPIASSSRLSQINDLLQHNRNTTAALVAVTKSAMSNNNDPLHNNYGNLKNDSNSLASSIDSIDTPPIMDTQSNSLSFDSLPIACNPAPIVAVIENNCNGGSPSNPPQMEPPP